MTFSKNIRHFTYSAFVCFTYFSGNDVQKIFANTKNLSIEKLPHYDRDVSDKNTKFEKMPIEQYASHSENSEKWTGIEIMFHDK